MRKPVFWVCDQERLKPACSATETTTYIYSYSIESLDIASIGIMLSEGADQTARMRRLIGVGASSLFAYDKTGFLMTRVNLNFHLGSPRTQEVGSNLSFVSSRLH